MSIFGSNKNEPQKPLELHPSLAQVITAEGLDPVLLSIDFTGAKNRRNLDNSEREKILVTDGRKGVVWNVPSVRGLFRGDTVPPSLSGEPPEPYYSMYKWIEDRVVQLSDVIGDKTDSEFEEAYSNVARRPDGKSMSTLHFYVW